MNNIYLGHMFGWGFGGAIIMLTFWVVFVLFIVWALKKFSKK